MPSGDRLPKDELWLWLDRSRSESDDAVRVDDRPREVEDEASDGGKCIRPLTWGESSEGEFVPSSDEVRCIMEEGTGAEPVERLGDGVRERERERPRTSWSVILLCPLSAVPGRLREPRM